VGNNEKIKMPVFSNMVCPGVKFAPRGQNSLLEDNFAPGGQVFPYRGEVKNGPLRYGNTSFS
jgi:hypothetical protein